MCAVIERKFIHSIMTRRQGDSVVIELPDGNQIRVVVMCVKNDQVYLGLDTLDDIATTQDKLPDTFSTRH